ncbi:hypothetical protein PRIEUP_LOCUS842 [Pristimantis euphronides]
MAVTSISIRYQILVLAAGLVFVAKLLINIFIVGVNISEWKKGRPMSTADRVTTTLGISKMVFSVVCLLIFIWDHYSYRRDFLFHVSIMFLESTCTCSILWLSALLSTIFYLKISTLNSAIFLRIKFLVLNRVFHLIVMSVVVSVSYAFINCLTDSLEISLNSTTLMYQKVFLGLNILIMVLFTSGPLLIDFISLVLLIIYLYHHMIRMRSRRNETSHLHAHYKTIKYTGFSLFCFTFHIIIEATSSYWHKVFGLWGLYLILQIFPILHSMYLICVTAKLRIHVSSMVNLMKRRC